MNISNNAVDAPSWELTENRLPMGKEFNCHHGFFELPSEILEIQISDDEIIFICEDGDYRYWKKENIWKIQKIR